MKKNHQENKTPYHVCHDCQINFESQKKVKEHFSMVHGRNQVSSQNAKTANHVGLKSKKDSLKSEIESTQAGIFTIQDIQDIFPCSNETPFERQLNGRVVEFSDPIKLIEFLSSSEESKKLKMCLNSSLSFTKSVTKKK